MTAKPSRAHWQAVIDVNRTGVLLYGREAAAHRVHAGRGGVIVNLSSVSRYGNAGQSNDAAAKAGVVALAEVWAKELALRHSHRQRCAGLHQDQHSKSDAP